MIRPTAEAAGAVAGVTAAVVQAQPMILGIPAGVLLAACAGALFGLAYTHPEAWGRLLSIPPGSRLYRIGWVILRASGLLTTLCAIALVSAWAVSVVPHVPMLTWSADVPPIPFAGLLAFAGQRVIPRALAAAERWLDRRSA